MESASLADAEAIVAMRLAPTGVEQPTGELSREEQKARIRAGIERDRRARQQRRR